MRYLLTSAATLLCWFGLRYLYTEWQYVRCEGWETYHECNTCGWKHEWNSDHYCPVNYALACLYIAVHPRLWPRVLELVKKRGIRP